MFHAPTSENKQPGDPTHAEPSPEIAREAHLYSGAVPARTAKRAAILQRRFGNQAVLRMLDQRSRNPPAGQGAAGRSNPPQAQIPLAAPPGTLQAKLVVGPANDPLEQEADRVAEQVMRMPDPEPAATAAPPRISRKCAGCEEEEAKKLQTKPAGTSEAAVVEAPSIVHDVLRSPGQPLNATTRAFFEPRFGHDFTGVRVHNNAGAASSARAVNARAYTLGNDVVFGAGQYSPDSGDGRRLLAHELAHVVQQRGTTPQKATISEARDRYQQPEAQALDDNASDRNTDSDPTYTAPVDQTPATQTALLQINKYSGHSAAVIFRSESVHPEEQYCEDLSKDSTASCSGIIECIEELIEQLAGRFDQFEGDPGHLERIKIVQNILKTLMVLAASTCKNGEYDKELEEEAQKWADKKPVQRKGPATEEQKKTLRERLPSVPRWVWAAIGVAAAALIIACFATGVCEAGAIIAAVGEGIGWIIIAAMRLAGVGLLAQAAEAAPSSDNGGTSAVA